MAPKVVGHSKAEIIQLLAHLVSCGKIDTVRLGLSEAV